MLIDLLNFFRPAWNPVKCALRRRFVNSERVRQPSQCIDLHIINWSNVSLFFSLLSIFFFFISPLFTSSQPNDTDVSTHNFPPLLSPFCTDPNLTSSAPAELCEVSFTLQVKTDYTHIQRIHSQTGNMRKSATTAGRQGISHANKHLLTNAHTFTPPQTNTGTSMCSSHFLTYTNKPSAKHTDSTDNST